MLLNLQRARKVMDRCKLDVLIATKPENVAYICDYMVPGHKFLNAPTFAVLTRDKAESALILPTGEIADVLYNKSTWIEDLRCYGTFYIESCDKSLMAQWERKLSKIMSDVRPTDSVETLIMTLKDKGLEKSRIGLDEMGVTPIIYETIKKKLPSATFLEAYDLLREIRMVKTREEIGRLKTAVSITEKAITSTFEIAKEGMTVEQLTRRLAVAMTDQGAIPVYTSIGISKENFVQYPKPTKKIKRGDLLRFDVGCMYKYYYSDIARTAIIGKPNDRQQNYFTAVEKGVEEALKLVKPGVLPSDIFNVAVDTVRRNGIPHYKRHHVGHGIGIELYDPPILSPTTTIPLEENMVINIECPYYEIGFGGVQVEECLVVTTTGYTLFNKLDRKLYQL